MSVPAFLAGNFRYLETAGVTDVNTIISDMRAELVNATNGWTEPVAGSFKSPVDSYGRFIVIALTRQSATRIAFVVTDKWAQQIVNDTFDIDAGGCMVRYFTGPDCCYVETVRATTPEFGMAWKANISPEIDGIDGYAWFAHTYRNSTGTTQTNTFSTAFGWNGSSYQSGEYLCSAEMYSSNVSFSNGRTCSGTHLFVPEECFHYAPGAAVWAWAGRMPQVVQGPNSLAAGSEVTIPIDDGVNATFKKTCSRTGTFGVNLFFRKA
jgi:hypothetical protein